MAEAKKAGADPGFVERGGGAQRLPRAPQARRFLEGPVSRTSLEFQRGGGGARAPCNESASEKSVRGRIALTMTNSNIHVCECVIHATQLYIYTPQFGHEK